MDMQRLLILRGLPEALKAFRSDKDFEGRLVEALRTHLAAGPRDSLYYQDRGTEDGQAFVIYLFNRAESGDSPGLIKFSGDECLYRVPYAVTPGGAMEFSFGPPEKVRERRDYVPDGEIAKAGPVANRPGLALDPLTHRWKKVGGMHDGDTMLQATDRRNMLAQHMKDAGYNVRHEPGHTGTTYIDHGDKTAAVQTSDDGDGLIATHHHTGDAMDSEWHGIDHHEDMHKFLRGLGHPFETAKAGPVANRPGLALDPTSHRWKKVSESLVQHHIPTSMNRDALAGALRKKGNAVADDVADDMHALGQSHGTHEAARYLLHAAYDGPPSKVHEVASHLRYGDYDKAVETAAGAHSEKPQEYVPPKPDGKRPGLTRDKNSGDFTRHAEAPNEAAAAAYEHAVAQDKHGAKADAWYKKSQAWPRRDNGSPVNATAYKKNERHAAKHSEAWAAHHNAMTGHLHGSAASGESDHAREKSKHANEWSAANGFGPAEALKAKAKGDNLTMDMFGGGAPAPAAAPAPTSPIAAPKPEGGMSAAQPAKQSAPAKPAPAGDDETHATVRKAQELMEVGHPSPFGQSWAAHSKATIDAAHRQAFPHKYGAGDPTHGGRLTAQKVTDKAGHQTTRYKKAGEAAHPLAHLQKLQPGDQATVNGVRLHVSTPIGHGTVPHIHDTEAGRELGPRDDPKTLDKVAEHVQKPRDTIPGTPESIRKMHAALKQQDPPVRSRSREMFDSFSDSTRQHVLDSLRRTNEHEAEEKKAEQLWESVSAGKKGPWWKKAKELWEAPSTREHVEALREMPMNFPRDPVTGDFPKDDAMRAIRRKHEAKRAQMSIARNLHKTHVDAMDGAEEYLAEQAAGQGAPAALHPKTSAAASTPTREYAANATKHRDKASNHDDLRDTFARRGDHQTASAHTAAKDAHTAAAQAWSKAERSPSQEAESAAHHATDRADKATEAVGDVRKAANVAATRAGLDKHRKALDELHGALSRVPHREMIDSLMGKRRLHSHVENAAYQESVRDRVQKRVDAGENVDPYDIEKHISGIEDATKWAKEKHDMPSHPQLDGQAQMWLKDNGHEGLAGPRKAAAGKPAAGSPPAADAEAKASAADHVKRGDWHMARFSRDRVKEDNDAARAHQNAARAYLQGDPEAYELGEQAHFASEKTHEAWKQAKSRPAAGDAARRAFDL